MEKHFRVGAARASAYVDRLLHGFPTWALTPGYGPDGLATGNAVIVEAIRAPFDPAHAMTVRIAREVLTPERSVDPNDGDARFAHETGQRHRAGLAAAAGGAHRSRRLQQRQRRTAAKWRHAGQSAGWPAPGRRASEPDL